MHTLRYLPKSNMATRNFRRLPTQPKLISPKNVKSYKQQMKLVADQTFELKTMQGLNQDAFNIEKNIAFFDPRVLIETLPLDKITPELIHACNQRDFLDLYNNGAFETLEPNFEGGDCTSEQFIELCCLWLKCIPQDDEDDQQNTPNIDDKIRELNLTPAPLTFPHASFSKSSSNDKPPEAMLEKLVNAAKAVYAKDHEIEGDNTIERFTVGGTRKSVKNSTWREYLAYYMGWYNDSATEVTYKATGENTVVVQAQWGLGNGALAEITKDGDNVIIAFRGTSPFRKKDIVLDMQYMIANIIRGNLQTNPLDAYGLADALNIILKEKGWEGKTLYTTGHSLGGTLSKEVGRALDCKSLSITPMADYMNDLTTDARTKRNAYLHTKNVTLYFEKDCVTGLTGRNEAQTTTIVLPAQGIFSNHGINEYVKALKDNALMNGMKTHAGTLTHNQLAAELF